MKPITLKIEDTLMDAVKAIEESPYRTVIVTDDEGKLIGSLTDGDIRRSLLKKGSLDTKLENVMNKNPISVKQDKSSEYMFKKSGSKWTFMPRCTIHICVSYDMYLHATLMVKHDAALL